MTLIQSKAHTPSSIALIQEASRRRINTHIVTPFELDTIALDRPEHGVLLRSTGIDYNDHDLKFFLDQTYQCQLHSAPQSMLKLRGKSEQAHFFQTHHLPHPPTWSFKHPPLGDGAFIVKPERSLGGLGQVFIQGQQSLTSLIKALRVWKDERFIIQDYLEKKGEWRFFYCLDEVEKPSVLFKQGEHWQGNRGHLQEQLRDLKQVPKELQSLALQAFEHSTLSYAGIDIIQTLNDEWYFLEINAVPGFQSFQERGVNIAARILNIFS